jgi:dihydroxyacetone kinase-like protein
MSSAASRIREQHAYLSQLDCIAGDGDHGTTMLRIMDRLENAFTGNAAVDLKTSFYDASWNVMSCDGGASSSLLGAFFLGISEAMESAITSWDCGQFAAGLEAGLRAVQFQTKARPGDKTLLDALAPAVDAFAAEARAGHDIGGALASAARAASAGASATRDLAARYGRARLLGDKTKGHQDPGAASIALIFEGFSQAMNELKGDAADARR